MLLWRRCDLSECFSLVWNVKDLWVMITYYYKNMTYINKQIIPKQNESSATVVFCLHLNNITIQQKIISKYH